MKKLLLLLLLTLMTLALPLNAKEEWEKGGMLKKAKLPEYGVLDCSVLYSNKFNNHGYMLDPIFCAIGSNKKNNGGEILGDVTTIKELYSKGWEVTEVHRPRDEQKHYILSKGKR